MEWLHDPGPERGDLPDDFKPVTISEQFIRHPAIGLGNAGQYTCKGFNSHATATKNIYIEGEDCDVIIRTDQMHISFVPYKSDEVIVVVFMSSSLIAKSTKQYKKCPEIRRV